MTEPTDTFSARRDQRVVGVLGGGQLGRMLIEAAHPMGIKVVVLDPLGPDSPAGLVTRAGAHSGDFKQADKVLALAAAVDILTVEIEHVDCDALAAVEAQGKEVQPPAATIRLIQDKYNQKLHLQQHKVALPEFVDCPDQAAVRAAGAKFGYPFMLKARRLAYDGRGNAVVKSEADIPSAVAALGGRALYAEKWVPFVRELAVMVVRNVKGQVAAYPVAETLQTDNICHAVLVPSSSPQVVQARALEVAKAAIASLSGAGVFGVELFELNDGTVLLNEIAPRPHNSGHYTIEACETSQFEAHLRGILGLPLGSTAMKVSCALMLNILGTGEEKATLALAGRAADAPGATLHWYGKNSDKAGRKMAHITVVAPDLPTLRLRVSRLQAPAADRMLAHAAPGVVGVIMGSDSDLPTMSAAAKILDEFGVRFELTIVSAHRTPDRMVDYAKAAVKRGLKVIIAGAGGAAHLPGMVAAITPLPVIGVPVKTSTLSGVDSLHSIVQMPRGIPVATVAIDNAMNAGLLAIRILAATDAELMNKLVRWQDKQREEVEVKAAALERTGYAAYLAQMSRS